MSMSAAFQSALFQEYWAFMAFITESTYMLYNLGTVQLGKLQLQAIPCHLRMQSPDWGTLHLLLKWLAHINDNARVMYDLSVDLHSHDATIEDVVNVTKSDLRRVSSHLPLLEWCCDHLSTPLSPCTSLRWIAIIHLLCHLSHQSIWPLCILHLLSCADEFAWCLSSSRCLSVHRFVDLVIRMLQVKSHELIQWKIKNLLSIGNARNLFFSIRSMYKALVPYSIFFFQRLQCT